MTQTHIEKAIQDAIKGGYERNDHNYTPHLGRWHLCELWIDPSFWKALAKSKGWVAFNVLHDHRPWRALADQFFSHIMDGNDAESFFASL